jgi:putative transcriptional regulator
MRWNLRMKAAERGIWKSTEMRRLLAAAGLEISSGKMSALWIRTPTTIRLDDLEVICSVLDCSPTDLLIREPDVVVERQAAQSLPPGPDQPAEAAEATSTSCAAVPGGRAKLITQIRHGRRRRLNRWDAHRLRSDQPRPPAWLLGLAQVPMTHAVAW